MKDWALNYIQHVLDATGWSMNRLASEAHLSPSTINRPMREPDWKHSISRTTIDKIRKATGIDPTPFMTIEPIDDDLKAEMEKAAREVRETTERLAERLAQGQHGNEIQIKIVGNHAEISAVLDVEGIAKLRHKLDALADLLDHAD